MSRGGDDAKRQLRVVAVSWLFVVSVVGAGGVGATGVVGGPDAGSVSTASSAPEQSEAPGDTPTGETTTPTTTESPRPLDLRFDFACEQVAVTARGYDSVTLVFADDERQTFRWSFRGRNVFFGTGGNVGAVVAEVVVRRDGQRVVQHNPSFEACVGRDATGATTPTVATGTTTAAGTGTTTTVATVTTTTVATDRTTIAAETTATSETVTTATATPTTTTLDLPTAIEIPTAETATTPNATSTAEATSRAATVTAGTVGSTTAGGPTATGTATVQTPTVTPQPIAGYPECSDEEFGLERVLNLSYADGEFTSANATEVGENRFRFAVAGETHEVELVEVERDERGRPVSVTFDATLPVDAVVVRTGSGANVYEFPEGVSRRAGLRAPTDRNTGQPFAIEELAFCYDPQTPTSTQNGGGTLGDFDLGLGLLTGRGATAAVGLAAAGLLAMRRRRAG